MALHFIADLHLEPRRPELTGVMQRYLAGPAREAEALYILGDLFEYWVGDDGGLRTHADTVAGIRRLADQGVPVYFMRGNRDFAVGDAFADAAGLTLLEDPATLDLDGRRVVLSHGDRLCTDDLAHQRFRARYTDPAWLNRMLALPLWQRQWIARYARWRSRLRGRRGDPEIMDVNRHTVRAFMAERETRLLIHGHTHRPADHELTVDGEPAHRLVLADWRQDHGEVLTLDNAGWERHPLI
ncbi:MAG: UDP-2,3-diacylglucosamine diphosphatase [Salinisphaeraceae bacterium]